MDFKDKDRQQSQGIYLFTGGIPDQDMVGVPRPGHPILRDPTSSPGGRWQLPPSMALQTGLTCRRLAWDVVWMQNLFLEVWPGAREAAFLTSSQVATRLSGPAPRHTLAK